ncbi:MAG: hypothetical protein AB7T22_15455 [Calditrichaceae bacterium]
MFSKTISAFITIILLSAVVLFAQDADKHIDARVGAMKQKLNLTDEQAVQIKDVILEIHELTDADRAQYKGDKEALMNAAKNRNELKLSKINAVLNEDQKAVYAEMNAGKTMEEKVVYMGERLNLTCDQQDKIAVILKEAPSDEEALETRKSNNPIKMLGLKSRTGKIHGEIESLLNDEQKAEFKKMQEEKKARMDKMLEEN